jgi:hypothetical protein
METAMNSHINRFNTPRRAPAKSATTPLDECRDMAARRLLDDYAEALRLSAGKLVGLAEEASGDRYHLHMDALQLVRDHPGEIARAFRGELIDRYNEVRRRVAGQDPAAPGESARLSLVEQDDLEESLAAQSMAHALRNHCGDELFALNRRLGLLLDAPDMDDTDNPLGPEVIGASVMASLNALENQLVGIKVRLLAMRVLTQTFPERARATYQDLNRQLVRRGILPVIKPVLIKARQEVAVAAQPAQPVEDPLAVLRGLLGANMAAGSTDADTPAPSEPFMRVLERMQRMESGDARRAKPGATPRAEVNILRSIKRLGGTVSPTSAMTLDVVALLFDFVLEDRRIPDAMKALIGRLQIPYLKAAILDPSFFSEKSHPARQFLDGLAEAALGWDADEGHAGGLYQLVDRLVRDILKRFDQNIEVFAEALESLRGHVREEERLARGQAERGARVVQAREMDALARREARDVVRDRLKGRVVPGPIRVFLTRFWASLLADLYRDAGLESRSWVEAVKTIDDLIWSVEPKSSQEERKRLVESLPDLLQRLDEGMQSLGLTRKEHDRFFATMVKCHAEAVRAGQQNDAPTAQAATDATAEADLAGVEEESPAPRDFQAVDPVDADGTAADADRAPLAESAPGGALDAGLRDGVAGLKPGAWIEYRQEDGATARARLFWISPLGGIYLFTNRLGQRAISISAEGLAEKLRAGEASIVDSTPLIDRAVSRAIDTLRHAAPQHGARPH